LKIFLKLYNDLTSNQYLLDSEPLFRSDEAFNLPLELTDCFSVLFRLFNSPIPHVFSPPRVIFHILDGSSVTNSFSGLGADAIANLDLILFGISHGVLSDILKVDPVEEWTLFHWNDYNFRRKLIQFHADR
jgi:hypothetical protein